jgi:Na+/glutamate symporter
VRLALFLACLGLGIACLLGGLFITRLTWRSDIEPFNRRSREFQIALHPDRYAGPERLFTIRVLNLTGALFILCALCVVAYDIASVVSHGH